MSAWGVGCRGTSLKAPIHICCRLSLGVLTPSFFQAALYANGAVGYISEESHGFRDVPVTEIFQEFWEPILKHSRH